MYNRAEFIGFDELKENTFWVNIGIAFLPVTSKYLQSLPYNRFGFNLRL